MLRRRFLAYAPLTAVPLAIPPAVAGPAAPVQAAPRPAETPPPSAEVPAGVVDIHLNRWAVVPRSGRAPTSTRDGLWATAAVLDDFRTAFHHRRVEQDVTARLVHDGSTLHVRLDHASGDDLTLVNLELLVSGSDAGTDCVRIPVRIQDSDPSFGNNWGPGIERIDDLAPQVSVGDGSVQVLVSLPFSRLGQANIGADAEWRITVLAQHRAMTRPLGSWIPIRRSSTSYRGGSSPVSADVTVDGCLGSIFLGSSPAAAVGRTAVLIADARPVLRYTGFRSKELTVPREHFVDPDLEFSLLWKAGSDPWVTLDGVERTSADDRTRFTFDHPAPIRNGLHQVQLRAKAGPPGAPRRSIVSFDRDALIAAGNQVQPTEGGR